mgnify:CR=1 FL=1
MLTSGIKQNLSLRIWIKLLLAITCLLSATLLQAQDARWAFRGGIMAFRGETTELGGLMEEPGIDFSMLGSLPFENARWRGYIELAYGQSPAERDVSENELGTSIYRTTSRHLFAGVGIKHIFNSNLNRYVPYQGMFNPYVAANVGAVRYRNTSNFELLDIEGFEIVEEPRWSLGVQGEAGAEILLDENWYLLAFGTLRYGFDDGWDGLDFNSLNDDWVVRLGLGFGYLFD